MLIERHFHSDIVTLNYAEGVASGHPFVLLHGGSARWQSMLPLIPDLSQNWHVYTPDLRGHGRSGHTLSYQLSDYVADCTSFLQQVVREPAILFGHSMGGHIAIMIAAWYPHLVRALIIGDAPFDRLKLRTILQRDHQRLRFWQKYAGPRHSPLEIAEALKQTPIRVEGQANTIPVQLLFGEEHPWYQEMAENLHHNDPEMLAAVIEFDQMHKHFTIEQLFPRITCPVLIIQGSPQHNSMLTNEEIENALRLLPDATVAKMETVGHALHMENKEPVLQAMQGFLHQLNAARDQGAAFSQEKREAYYNYQL